MASEKNFLFRKVGCGTIVLVLIALVLLTVIWLLFFDHTRQVGRSENGAIISNFAGASIFTSEFEIEGAPFFIRDESSSWKSLYLLGTLAPETITLAIESPVLLGLPKPIIDGFSGAFSFHVPALLPDDVMTQFKFTKQNQKLSSSLNDSMSIFTFSRGGYLFELYIWREHRLFILKILRSMR